MRSHHLFLHLDADEDVTATAGEFVDVLRIGKVLGRVELVLDHQITPTVRAAFLRKLAEAASDLADEIVLRDLEAAS